MRRALTVLLAFSCLPAYADGVSWSCVPKWRDSSIVECRELEPSAERAALFPEDPLPPTYMAELFAPGQSKNITRLVRTAPEQYAGRTWAIPLISPLIDAARGRELVQAVMCGREPDCSVELTIR